MFAVCETNPFVSEKPPFQFCEFIQVYAESTWSSWCANSAPNADASYSIRHNPGFGIAASCRMRHDRRTCARLWHAADGELEQIQFLLGHISIQTTERYLGCKQRIQGAVNDQIGIEPPG